MKRNTEFRPVSGSGVIRSGVGGASIFQESKTEKLATDFLIEFSKLSDNEVIVETPDGVYWMP